MKNVLGLNAEFAPSRTPVAFRNLAHQKVKTAIAVTGVAFCLVLIFMQLGFFGAVVETATVVLSKLRFDAVIVSRDYQFLFFCGNFPTARLNRAKAVEGVRSVEQLLIGASPWLCPPNAEGEARRRTMMVFGIRPPSSIEGAVNTTFPFALPELSEQLQQVRQSGVVLMDRRSRSDFGPIEINGKRELGNRQVVVGGAFALGSGFGADGAVIASDLTFRRVVPGYPSDASSLGLVLFQPDVFPEQGVQRLRAALSDDVRVFSRKEVEWNDIRYWILDTPIGVIFLSGVCIAFFVGVVVTYQTLANDIANHFAEYATLKAMGYGDGYLSGVVLRQAFLLALAGYLPAYGISIVLFRLTERRAQIPMHLAGWIAGMVFALAIAMCISSALIAIRKVKNTDPAELF